MEKKQLRAAILKEIDKGNKILIEDDFSVTSAQFDEAISFLQREGYLKGITWASDRPLLEEGLVYLTEKGENYLNPTEKPTQGNTTYNIQGGNFSGASLGSNNIVTNNWNNSIADLKEYVSELPKEEEKIGNELIEIVEAGNLEKGISSKFSSFLEKHPNLVELTGKALVWSLLNADKLI